MGLERRYFSLFRIIILKVDTSSFEHLITMYYLFNYISFKFHIIVQQTFNMLIWNFNATLRKYLR